MSRDMCSVGEYGCMGAEAMHSVQGERKIQYTTEGTISVFVRVAISSVIMSKSHIGIIIHNYY